MPERFGAASDTPVEGRFGSSSDEAISAPTSAAPTPKPSFLDRAQQFGQQHPYLATGASLLFPAAAPLVDPNSDIGKGAAKRIGRDAFGAVTGMTAGPIGSGLGYIADKTGLTKKVEKATEPSNDLQRGGSYATLGTEMALPLPGAGSKASAAGKTLIENRMVASTDPIPSIIKAVKPKSTSVNFDKAIANVLPEVKAASAELGRPIGGGADAKPGQAVYDTIKSVQSAKTKLWGQIQQHLNAGEEMGVKVDLSPLSEVSKKSIPAYMRVQDPRGTSALELSHDAAYNGKSMTIPEAEDLLQSLNAKLDTYYQKYPTAQRSAIAKNPETASDYATAEKLRDIIYSKLNDVTGSPALRSLKQKYGHMIEVEKNLWPRLNVAMRQNPDSLSEQFGKWEAAGDVARGAAKIGGALLSGHPSLAWSAVEDLASAYAKKTASSFVKDANTTDTLLRRAFANFKGTPEVTPPPIPFQAKGLLGPGATRMPGVADASGAIPSPGPYPGAGMSPSTGRGYLPAPTTKVGGVPDASGPIPNFQANPTSMRQLSAPTTIPQTGFATAEELVPYTNPSTGKIEYVPKWWLQGANRLGKPLAGAAGIGVAGAATPPGQAQTETRLNPKQEQQFAEWKAKYAPHDSGKDYDLRGAFIAGQGQDGRGHFTDKFKKPNHPTFSNESQYSGKGNGVGGRWAEENGKTVFYASPANLKYHSAAELQRYFKEQEPDAILVLPK